MFFCDRIVIYPFLNICRRENRFFFWRVRFQRLFQHNLDIFNIFRQSSISRQAAYVFFPFIANQPVNNHFGSLIIGIFHIKRNIRLVGKVMQGLTAERMNRSNHGFVNILASTLKQALFCRRSLFHTLIHFFTDTVAHFARRLFRIRNKKDIRKGNLVPDQFSRNFSDSISFSCTSRSFDILILFRRKFLNIKRFQHSLIAHFLSPFNLVL